MTTSTLIGKMEALKWRTVGTNSQAAFRNEAYDEAIAIIRQHEAEQPQGMRAPGWTAREAFACASCWAEFNLTEDMAKSESFFAHRTPESYWLSISERARNEHRAIANKKLFLAIARYDAVPVGLSLQEGEFEALKAELGLKADHRVHSILKALYSVFRNLPKRGEA